MRVPHVYDASFVLQYILHELEQSKVISVKELSEKFEYDTSSIYKLIKKIDLNYCIIDSHIRIKKLGGGMFTLLYEN